MSFPLDKPLYRYAVSKQGHPWRNYRRRDNPNAALVRNLGKIESDLRTEIAREQVDLMPNGLMAQRLKAKKRLPRIGGL